MRNLPRREGREGVPASGNVVSWGRAAGTENGPRAQRREPGGGMNSRHLWRISRAWDRFEVLGMNFTMESSHRCATFSSVTDEKTAVQRS